MGVKLRRSHIKLKPEGEAALQKWDDRLAVVVGVVMFVLIALAVAAAVVMLVKTYAGKQPSETNPLITIFASRLMILTARLSILAVGLFVVLSVLVHMRRGQWLTAAGPFKVSGAARTVTQSLQRRLLQTRIVEADRERLKARVSDLTTEVRRLEQLLRKAQEELQRKQEH